jgi:predicted RNA-binding protein
VTNEVVDPLAVFTDPFNDISIFLCNITGRERRVIIFDLCEDLTSLKKEYGGNMKRIDINEQKE